MSRIVIFASIILSIFLYLIYLYKLFKYSIHKKDMYICIFLCCIFYVIICSIFFNYTIDDTYISLRYARNLTSGHGLVFSTDGSKPIEGYTNFLWIILESILFKITFLKNVLLGIKIIGILFGTGIVILTYKLTYLISNNVKTSIIATSLISLFPNIPFWSISGLETPMYIFFLMLSIYLYVKKELFFSSIVFALAALSRPEGVLVFAIFSLYEISIGISKKKESTEKYLKKIILFLLPFILIFGSYYIWRYNFYGFLFTNSFYAKGNLNIFQSILGRVSCRLPFLHFTLPIIAIGVIAFLENFHKYEMLKYIFITFVTLFFLSFVAEREWMPGFRYELPFIPFIIIIFSIGLKDIMSVKKIIYQFIILFTVILYLFYPAINLHTATRYTIDLEKSHVALGKWLNKYVPKDSSFAGWDMGAIPYFSELPTIIEIHPEGLLNAFITHSKYYDEDYLIRLKPSFIVLPSSDYKKIEINPKNELSKFYKNNFFRENYIYLSTFSLRNDYNLRLYKYKEIQLSKAALEEIDRLSKKSIEANL